MHTLKCLELFKAVADHRSFSRAAAANNLNPGAVTRAIQELESELGVRLLNRTTRRLDITEIGMTVYDSVTQLLDRYSEIVSISQQCSNVMTGTVRVAMHHLLGFNAYAALLDGFMASHPGVSVQVECFDDGTDPLEAGADIAISLESQTRATYVARPLGAFVMSLYASPDCAVDPGDVSPAEIAEEDRLSASGAPWELHDNGSGQRLSLACRSRFRSDSPQAIAAAAVRGVGIALLPPGVAQPWLDAGRLRPVFEDWQSKPSRVSIIYRSRRLVPERVRGLIAHLCDAMNASAASRFSPTTPSVLPTFGLDSMREHEMELVAECDA